MAESSLRDAALRAVARLTAATQPARGAPAPPLSFGGALAARVLPAASSPLEAEAEDIALTAVGGEKGRKRSRGHLAPGGSEDRGLTHLFAASSSTSAGGLLLQYAGLGPPTASTGLAPFIRAALAGATSAGPATAGGSVAASVSALPRFVRKGQETDAGKGWFNMPAQTLTPELKRDLLILRNRAFLDPKRHYKTQREDRAGDLPKFFQVGTVVEGPHERRSKAARLTNAERSGSITAALAADDKFNAYAERTTAAVHKRATAGGVGAYKKKKAEQGSKGMGPRGSQGVRGKGSSKGKQGGKR